MRNNPNNNTLGNLVEKEADNNNPETSFQSQITRDSDYINISEAIDNRISDIVRENSNHIHINKASDKRISDVEEENNN
jgi:hypothetical protein